MKNTHRRKKRNKESKIQFSEKKKRNPSRQQHLTLESLNDIPKKDKMKKENESSHQITREIRKRQK